MMSLLADVACGLFEPKGNESEADLRQLGYSAYLARGRVRDPEDRLGSLVRTCREILSGSPVPEGQYRDPIQARWGAPWHLDAAKLKTELPLHLMRLERNADRSATPSP